MIVKLYRFASISPTGSEVWKWHYYTSKREAIGARNDLLRWHRRHDLPVVIRPVRQIITEDLPPKHLLLCALRDSQWIAELNPMEKEVKN